MLFHPYCIRIEYCIPWKLGFGSMTKTFYFSSFFFSSTSKTSLPSKILCIFSHQRHWAKQVSTRNNSQSWKSFHISHHQILQCYLYFQCTVFHHFTLGLFLHIFMYLPIPSKPPTPHQKQKKKKKNRKFWSLFQIQVSMEYSTQFLCNKGGTTLLYSSG